MKRGRQYSTKVSVAKRKKQFAGAKKVVVVGDYQAGRELGKLTPKQELKAFDNALTTNTFNTIANPPVFQVLNAQVNGAELYQRVGRKCYMKSLRIRGVIQPNGVSAEFAARMLIIYDSQPNAANPTIQALLQDSSAAGATTWASEINLINRQRFKVLRDKQFLLGNVANVGGATEIVPDPIKNSLNVDEFIDLNGLETIYNGTNGGTIADITSGALHIVTLGDANAGGYNLNYTTRLRYYD